MGKAERRATENRQLSLIFRTVKLWRLRHRVHQLLQAVVPQVFDMSRYESWTCKCRPTLCIRACWRRGQPQPGNEGRTVRGRRGREAANRPPHSVPLFSLLITELQHMRIHRSARARQAFTLIEILIVVVILGILAAIVIP
ncbi:MAG: type II secretion system protein, partial [Planctomycetota bacterium]